MMNILKINRHHEYPQNIFEVGLVMVQDELFNDMVREEMHLACCVCHPKANFTEAKEIFDSLMWHLELKYGLKKVEHNSFIPERCGKIIVQGKEIGKIGEIHPKVLNNWELEVPVSCFEIDLGKIFETLKR
jgi:phenylalanyl-tRNA synthetase beta chain